MLPAPWRNPLEQFHPPAMSINVNKTITVTCSWAKARTTEREKGWNCGSGSGLKRMNSQRLWTWCHVRVAGKGSPGSHQGRRTGTKDGGLPCSCRSWSFQIEAGWPLNKNPPTRWAKCTVKKGTLSYMKVSSC